MVGHVKSLETIELKSETIKNTSMQVLISPSEGWEGHVMRVLHVEKDGYTTKHSHPWYHVNYILEGNGELLIGDQVHHLTKGSYAYVPKNVLHQFKNTGDTTFSFICIVVEEGHKI
ncbi:MAG: cupin domain-containing protein [Acholeplasmataceae bacterium]